MPYTKLHWPPQVEEMQRTVSVAEKNPARFGLSQPEISSRRKWINDTKQEVRLSTIFFHALYMCDAYKQSMYCSHLEPVLRFNTLAGGADAEVTAVRGWQVRHQQGGRECPAHSGSHSRA